MSPVDLVVGLGLVVFFTIFSARTHLLTLDGMVAALILGTAVTLSAGLTWLVLVLGFYLAAGGLTRYGYATKLARGVAESKGGVRSWANVFANGGIAALFAIGEGLLGGGVFFGGFLGSLAAAASDTLATEIGTLYPGEPRLITQLRKRVKTGTSGGVSPYGEIAIFLAATILGLAAYVLHSEWGFFKTVLVALTAGFIGATSDSLLGATLQAKYQCPSCHEPTETRFHKCGAECVLTHGTPVLNNHAVNFLSTVVGGLVGVLLASLP